MRVLDISGSLRRDSHNAALLRAAGELVEEEGAEFEVFDGLKAIPPYDRTTTSGAAHRPSPISGARSPARTRCCSRPRNTTRRSPAC